MKNKPYASRNNFTGIISFGVWALKQHPEAKYALGVRDPLT